MLSMVVVVLLTYNSVWVSSKIDMYTTVNSSFVSVIG